MQKCLKKQIFQSKISNFLKTNSIILFFAIFDLPQKKRGELKKHINTIVNNKKKESKGCVMQSKNQTVLITKYNLENFPSPQCKECKSGFTCPACLLYLSKQQAAVFSDEKRELKPSHLPGSCFPLMLQNTNTIETLHITNKCFQNTIKSTKLPLYGQTLIIAVPHEKDLVFFSTFLSLYKGVLLGGFDKGQPQTKSYFTALCNKVQNKGKVHRECLNVLSSTFLAFIKTGGAPSINCLRLLNYIAKR